VSRCPWARHLTPAAPVELPSVYVWMSEWMGECEAICKALWWPLSLWKRYINAVHLPF